MHALRPALARSTWVVGLTLMLASAGWSAPHNYIPAQFDHFAYLPVIARSGLCSPIAGANYAALPTAGPPTDRPAESHPDLNLAVRGYIPTDAYLGLVDYGGDHDPRAPQLRGLFADRSTPAKTT